MPLTVARLQSYLATCDPNDKVVVAATLGDGTVIGADDLNVGTDQGGPDGEGFEVVIDWEPGSEIITRP